MTLLYKGGTIDNELNFEQQAKPDDNQSGEIHNNVRIHPTQKPVDLLRYLVLTYSNTGGVILDSCVGSGTTCIACIRENRHFIGFELNKEYYDKACERIRLEQQQPQLF